MEVVLGGAIVIPITVGYFGVDGMIELVNKAGGLGLGFRTLPYLFQQWGPILAVLAGVMWFGLLFFAGITSSLAMGTPIMGFMRDEFGWKRENSAWLFGALILILGLPTVVFFNYGVFDEYDYWAGTVSLVIFALFETILFAWIFGINRGWKEITMGADIKVPIVFKYVIKYVTPVILGAVFIGSLPSIMDTINNTAIHEQLATATDETTISTLKKTIFFKNISRFALLGMWVSIAVAVAIAYRKRMREGRFTNAEA